MIAFFCPPHNKIRVVSCYFIGSHLGLISHQCINMNPTDSDGDNELCKIGEDGQKIRSKGREALFITLMEEEVLIGNRFTTTFTKESWRYIKEELGKKTKFNYTDSQLKNKFNQLRSHHRDFGKLLKETGMGYVVSTGQVTAIEEV